MKECERIESVTVHAPATVANVGSAFDAIGFAVHDLGDTVTASLSANTSIQIRSIEGDMDQLSKDAKRNTASVAVHALLCALGNETLGITLDIYKGLPIGSGLGSSSASAAAAVVAVNELLEKPFSRHQLVPFAMEGERIACGTAHADNVAPAILGGFILIRNSCPLEIIELPSPAELCIALVIPNIELRTSDARKVLRDTISLRSATRQWANVAGLVAGLYRGDLNLIGRSIEDVIIEPQRSKLIPGFYDVQQAALQRGALGCSISGAGPSLFAISDSNQRAQDIGRAMAAEWNNHGIEAKYMVSQINTGGATLVSSPVSVDQTTTAAL
jgi:homoserine kinase